MAKTISWDSDTQTAYHKCVLSVFSVLLSAPSHLGSRHASNVINSGIVMSPRGPSVKYVSLRNFMYTSAHKMVLIRYKIPHSEEISRNVQNFCCTGMLREKIHKLLCLWTSVLHATEQPKRLRVPRFPISLPYFSCVAIVSHTFLLAERSERDTKRLNTWKYSERTRRSVGVRRST